MMCTKRDGVTRNRRLKETTGKTVSCTIVFFSSKRKSEPTKSEVEGRG